MDAEAGSEFGCPGENVKATAALVTPYVLVCCRVTFRQTFRQGLEAGLKRLVIDTSAGYACQAS